MIANVWAVLRDESVYPQAGRFLPERFLEHGARDPTDAAFGFGRRCVSVGRPALAAPLTRRQRPPRRREVRSPAGFFCQAD